MATVEEREPLITQDAGIAGGTDFGGHAAEELSPTSPDSDDEMLQPGYGPNGYMAEEHENVEVIDIDVDDSVQNDLEYGMDAPDDADACWKPQYFGNFLRMLAAVCLFAIVLLGNISSKIYLVVLTDHVRTARQEADDQGAHRLDSKGTVAYLALLFCVLMPLLFDLLLRFYVAASKTRQNSPWPTNFGLLCSFISGTLEGGATAVFVLLVAVRCAPLVVLVLMLCVFVAPAVENLGTTIRKLMAGVSEDMVDPSSFNVPEERVSNCSAVMCIIQVSRKSFAALLQLAVVAFLPIATLFHWPKGVIDDELVGVYATGCLIAVSVAWLPSLQKSMQRACKPGAMFLCFAQTKLRQGVLPTARTARVRAAVFTSFFRVVAAFGTVALITALDSKAQGVEKVYFFDMIHKYNDIMAPLIVHLVCGFFAYHAARFACMLGMQISCFCVPLYLSTICTFAVLYVGAKMIPFGNNNHSAKIDDDWTLLGVLCLGIIAWISQVLITFGSAWNSEPARLARDETLFWQPSYNSVFLEQYTIINRIRRSVSRVQQDALPTASELKRSQIFICTTMYREDEREMKQLLRSVLSVDADLGPGKYAGDDDSHRSRKTCAAIESHVFMDGGANGDNIQDYAQQLLYCVGSVVLELEQERMARDPSRVRTARGHAKRVAIARQFLDSAKIIKCPYGLRVRLLLPYGTKMFIHLKDKSKVKAKKRWSQVMYMYYFLQYRCRRTGFGFEEGQRSNRQYILATDADVRFSPRDVKALLMVLARNPAVGAVCARTFPLGSGIMYWYQVFDYAVGHWFQKAAEHVLGTVLCCPGCFSMYRMNALRHVAKEYATEVAEAFEFLTKDMGEDRWLCTLLVQAGWRLDYCAAAEDYTYCPEDFDTFYKQRRRWTSSTIANIIELLAKGGKASRMNDSVSWLFLGYQFLMLISTAIGPATVLLVMSGGLASVLGWSVSVINGILWSVTGAFVLVCMFAPDSVQLNIAKLLTALSALFMAIVAIGLAIQIADEQTSGHHHHTTTTTAPHKPTTNLSVLLDEEYVLSTSPVSTTFISSSGIYNANESDSHLAMSHDSIFVAKAAQAAGAAMQGVWHTVSDMAAEEKNDMLAGFSVSSFYLLALIAMFLVAAALHLKECLALINGIFYLLALPSGYVFLMIYAVCNLDDRSWGTRVSGTAEAGAAEVRNRWYHRLLFGCGLGRKESYMHFLGRLLCCRRLTDARDEEEADDIEQKKGDSKKAKVVLPSDVFKVDTTDNVAVLQVTDLDLLETVLEAIKSNSASSCDQVEGLTERISDAANMSLQQACSVLLSRTLANLPVFYDRVPEGIWDDMTQSFSSELTPELAGELLKRIVDFKENYLTNHMEVDRSIYEQSTTYMTLEAFLRKNKLPPSLCLLPLKREGIDDTTFLAMLDAKFIDSSEISTSLERSLQGIVIKRKLLKAISLLPPFKFPEAKEGLAKWLQDLHLPQYLRNLEWFGFGDDNLAQLSTLTDEDLKLIGITKRAHLQRLKKALDNMGFERPDEDAANDREFLLEKVEELVSRVPKTAVPLDEHENGFWRAVIDKRLKPELKIIKDEGELKTKLHDLKVKSVGAFVIINALWLVLMVELANSRAASLHVAGTNPLGLIFLTIYGGIFAIQFLTMLIHRLYTMMHIVASAFDKTTFAKPKHRRSRPTSSTSSYFDDSTSSGFDVQDMDGPMSHYIPAQSHDVTLNHHDGLHHRRQQPALVHAAEMEAARAHLENVSAGHGPGYEPQSYADSLVLDPPNSEREMADFGMTGSTSDNGMPKVLSMSHTEPLPFGAALPHDLDDFGGSDGVGIDDDDNGFDGL